MINCFRHVLIGHIVLFLLGPFWLCAQNIDTPKVFKNGISHPNMLPVHPFGLLFYTLPHNFNIAPRQSVLEISITSGNIWGQPVDVFIPTNNFDRSRMSELPFFSRTSEFNPAISPSEFYQIQYDGVVKDFRVSYSFSLGESNSFRIGTRSFLLTEGRLPFSIFTGDEFIEFFHRAVAGGDDPFGRKIRGLNQAGINYLDRNGRSLDIKAGEFVFSGIEFAYYHFPKILVQRKIHMNFGVHLGTNLSQYNRSMDLGASIAGIKSFTMANKDLFQIGLGINVLRRSLIEFSSNQTDLGTSNFIGSLESHFEYAIISARGGVHSIGLNYRIQTPYNQKREDDYYVPVSPERIARWHDAAGHLYKFPSYWSLIYSFTKKVEISFYILQDLLVNNVPDFQTGVQLSIPLKRK